MINKIPEVKDTEKLIKVAAKELGKINPGTLNKVLDTLKSTGIITKNSNTTSKTTEPK